MILFNCSAGSAGMSKKERRLKYAAYTMGLYFCKHIRRNYRRSFTKALMPLRNIIVVLRAPIT